jgi:hypothetical protein
MNQNTPFAELTNAAIGWPRARRLEGDLLAQVALPLGGLGAGSVNGQLGGILKLWRDWQICGDRDRLLRLLPLARLSLD